MDQIRKLNFRYRGPIESDKVRNMISQITSTINKLINDTETQLDNTSEGTIELINTVKRRSDYGTS